MLLVVAVGLAVALPLIAAPGWDGYSHGAQYISELGAHEAPNGRAVSFGFMLIGVLLLAGTVALVRRCNLEPAVVAVAMVGVGLGVSYVIAGVSRCDPGCPSGGEVSSAQAVHNGAAVLGYALAVGGLIMFGIARRCSERWRILAWSGLVGGPVLVVVAAFGGGEGSSRGLVQRIIELALFAWFLAAGRALILTDDAAP